METNRNYIEDSKAQIETWEMKAILNDKLEGMSNKELIDYFKNQHSLIEDFFNNKITNNVYINAGKQ
jgi:hypothetical protein